MNYFKTLPPFSISLILHELPTPSKLMYSIPDLRDAAGRNDFTLLNNALDEGADLFDETIWRGGDPAFPSRLRPRHPIWAATEKGSVEFLKVLLERGGIGAQLNDRENSQLLWRATCNNQIGVVQMFLAKGVDPWRTGESRHLSETVRSGNIELFALLLSDYTRRSTKPIKEWNDAYLALKFVRDNEIFTELLITAGIDVNRAEPEPHGSQKWRPLHRCGYPGPAKLLLDAGADPNIDADDKWGPLACVVGEFMPTATVERSSEERRHRRMEMIQLLFARGADPMRAGGGMALHGALRDSDYSSAELLVQNGARINVPELRDRDQEILNQAVKDRRWEVVMALTPPNWSFINYVSPGLNSNGRSTSLYRLPGGGHGILPPWLDGES